MTFIQNLGRFLDAVGPNNGDVAWWLSSVDWPTDADREEFIGLMGHPDGGPT